MPRRAQEFGAPKKWVDDTAGGTWPAGPLKADSPPGVLYAAEIAKALRKIIDDSGESITAVAEALKVHRSTLYGWLDGDVYIDSFSLAAAEAHFQTRLWPDTIPTT